MSESPRSQLRYGSSSAMRKAVRDRLASLAQSRGGHGLKELQRHVAYDRLLARVFSLPDGDRWVLKGAGALLARLPDARHSRDIDLAYSRGPGSRDQPADQVAVSSAPACVEEAVAQLRAAAGTDLGDFFRFEVTRVSPLQEEARGRRLDLDAYLGARYAAFHVDVVVGTAMTATPELAPPLTPLSIEGLVRPSYRLFPLVDHIADKLCAVLEVHHRAGRTQPSTRVKDLVDLALIASTQVIDGPALHRAITLGASHRQLWLPRQFCVPDVEVWRKGYPGKAREAAGPVPPYDQAVGLVASLLDPLLAGDPVAVWNPERTSWT